MGSARFERGMETRREVLGEVHEAAAEAQKTEFDADFQRLSTEMAWGSVWARPGLDRRTRSLVTIAMLAALGRNEELGMHLRAGRTTGVPQSELKEVLLQVAIYAGAPAANAAFKLAKSTFEDSEPGELRSEPTNE